MTPTVKPKTVEDDVHVMAERMAKSLDAMDSGARAAVMHALLRNAVSGVRYNGQPDRAALVRLAAHAIVWAESVDRKS